MLSYRTIGRNIKAARDRLDFSQEKVAGMLGISLQHYGKLERGEVRQNIDRLEQICELLSIPIETLFIGASPRTEFTNLPEPDGTEKRIARMIHGCDAEYRQAILQICETIASLNK